MNTICDISPDLVHEETLTAAGKENYPARKEFAAKILKDEVHEGKLAAFPYLSPTFHIGPP